MADTVAPLDPVPPSTKRPPRLVASAIGSWLLVVFATLLCYTSIRHIVGCSTSTEELGGKPRNVSVSCFFGSDKSGEVEDEPASPAAVAFWTLAVLLHLVLCVRCVVQGPLAKKLAGGALLVLSPATCFGLVLYAVLGG